LKLGCGIHRGVFRPGTLTSSLREGDAAGQRKIRRSRMGRWRIVERQGEGPSFLTLGPAGGVDSTGLPRSFVLRHEGKRIMRRKRGKNLGWTHAGDYVNSSIHFFFTGAGGVGRFLVVSVRAWSMPARGKPIATGGGGPKPDGLHGGRRGGADLVASGRKEKMIDVPRSHGDRLEVEHRDAVERAERGGRLESAPEGETGGCACGGWCLLSSSYMNTPGRVRRKGAFRVFTRGGGDREGRQPDDRAYVGESNIDRHHAEKKKTVRPGGEAGRLVVIVTTATLCVNGAGIGCGSIGGPGAGGKTRQGEA